MQHLRVMEALDEDEEGDGRHPAVQRVVEADLAKELQEEERVAQPEALVLGEREEEVEVAVVVAVERRLLDERLEQHADRYEGLLLQRVLHIAHEELTEHRLVVVLNQRESEHLKEDRRDRVRHRSELVEESEELHVRGELQLELRVAARALQFTEHH